MGQGPAKFTKQEGKFGKFCHQKTQKLRKSPNCGVISEIQRAKFGVFVTYIFGGKIRGSNKNFRGKFWGEAPPTSLYGSTPWANEKCHSKGFIQSKVISADFGP